MAEPISDAELDNLRPLAEPLSDGRRLHPLQEAFALECLPALLARLDWAEQRAGGCEALLRDSRREAARLRAGYRALLEKVVRVVEEQQSGPDPDPESARVLLRLRGELEGLRG
jgi:hypothetical protein